MTRYLITKKSSNRKVGPIMVTTASSNTCPDACPLKNGGCYAKGGPLGMLWANLSDASEGQTTIKNGRGEVSLKSHKELVQAISELKPGELWRHNQAGDLPGEGDYIDGNELIDIVIANQEVGARGFTYTHKPVLEVLYDGMEFLKTGRVVAVPGVHHRIADYNKKCIESANARGFTINLSADNLDDADRKADLNIGPVAVVLPEDQTTNTVTPAGRKVVVCPATQRDDVSCKSCQLCQRQRDFIVGFPAHGASKRKASAIASK